MALRRWTHHDRLLMISTLAAICIMAWPLLSAALAGGKIDSFSADQVEIDASGKVVGTTKIYVTPKAYRMDGMPGAGRQNMPKADMTFLGFRNQNKQYIYNHDKKLFFESSIDENAMAMDMKKYQNVDSEQVLGKETVSGYPCVKKQITTTYTIMGMRNTVTQLIWTSDQFDFPLRTQSQQGDVTELRNIKTDQPSEKLFRRPTGYRKVGNMMQVMGINMGAMGKGRSSAGRKMPAAPRQGMDDVNMNDLMAGMKQSMGKNMDPKQMQQMQEMMAQAADRAKQVKTDSGAADAMWQIIPKRPGDEIGSELKSPNIYNVVMGTNTPFKSVCTFYENQLKQKGWQVAGTHVQNGQGFLNLMKGQQQLMVSSADNPGMGNKYRFFYALQLSGPGI